MLTAALALKSALRNTEKRELVKHFPKNFAQVEGVLVCEGSKGNWSISTFICFVNRVGKREIGFQKDEIRNE